MMDKTIAHIVVPFGESATGANGDIVAEWDDTMNVLFAGRVLNTYLSQGVRHYIVLDGATLRDLTATDIKSQFIPGEKVYLLIHSPVVNIVAVKATYGTLTKYGTELLSRSENVSFPVADEPQSLKYYPSSDPSLEWYGNIGRDDELSGKDLKIGSGQIPCIAKATYPVLFTRYTLQTPKITLDKTDTCPISVYIYYEVEQ